MISSRAADFGDIQKILSNLSLVTKSEIENSEHCGDIELVTKTFLLYGPADISFVDDDPLFIVGHFSVGNGLRSTWCLAGAAVDTFRKETIVAALSQVERMLLHYPRETFVSISYSSHPKRDLFFATMGFSKVEDLGKAAVFELSPVATATKN